MSQQVYVIGSRSSGIVVSPEPRSNPGNSVTFQARLCANEGTGADVTAEGDAFKQADVDTISRRVINKTAGDAVVSGPTSLTVSAVIEDTLTTGNEQWTLDTIGRNFADTFILALANTVYRVEYTITLDSGAVAVLIYQHSTSGGA